MSANLTRSVVAEFLGTALLVFVAVGSAVAGFEQLGPTGVALAFGLVLLALAYGIGPVSGCHVNPAVTLGVLLSRGMTVAEAGAYWAAQFAGGIAGAALLRLLTSSFGDVTDQTGSLGSNDWGATISAGGAFVLEVLLTFAFVLVILLVTGKATAPGFAGLAIGLALTAVHLVGIPLTGTSVNPARSLGPALFAGGDPLAHVWLFLVAPLVGAVLAVLVARVLAVPLVSEQAATGPLPADRTGAELPADAVPTSREASPDERGARSQPSR
ncbi:aquaporin [Geodermatophilus sabuli]|uniref:Aquaporin n=1 Tax=Geodermatophilus sabuli TaxID=1564158 RepID=A0A7K3W7Q7_9ACTN|nr:aquaporin [Geodermatophilus sabuli]